MTVEYGNLHELLDVGAVVGNVKYSPSFNQRAQNLFFADRSLLSILEHVSYLAYQLRDHGEGLSI